MAKRKSAKRVEYPQKISAAEMRPLEVELPVTRVEVSAALDEIAKCLYGRPTRGAGYLALEWFSHPHHGPGLSKLNLPEWAFQWAAYKLVRAGLVTATRDILLDKESQDLGMLSTVIRATPRLFKLWGAGKLAEAVEPLNGKRHAGGASKKSYTPAEQLAVQLKAQDPSKPLKDIVREVKEGHPNATPVQIRKALDREAKRAQRRNEITRRTN